MNHNNIQKVIDWLNAGAPGMAFSMYWSLRHLDLSDIHEGGGFHPQEFEKLSTGKCRSVCCIAGAAAQFNGNRPEEELRWDEIQDAALEYFGIAPTNHYMLSVFDMDEAPSLCGPKMAAKALNLWAQYAEQDPTFNPWPEICGE